MAIEQIKTPMERILELDRVESLRDFRLFQGEKLTVEQAEKLRELQQTEIIEGINDAIACLTQIDGNAVENPEFTEAIGRVRGVIEGLRLLNEHDPAYVGNLRSAADSLYAELESLYASPALEDKRIAVEYAIGLGRSEINVRIGLLVARKMQEDSPERFVDVTPSVDDLSFGHQVDGNVIDGFEPTAEISNSLVRIMNQAYFEASDDYWGDYDAAQSSVEGLDELARNVVSMQYTPEQEDMDAVGLMQSAHWAGFGGTGELFSQIPGLNKDFIKSQKIGWHAEGEPFSDKLAHFKAAIIPLKQREAETVGKLADELFADKETIRIFDSGAGPVARGSHGIAAQLEQRGKKVVISASDVDGNSLRSLAQLSGKAAPNDALNATTVGEAFYWDANFPLENAPSDVAEIFETSVMLHQVMDKNQGHQRVGAFLQAATKMTVEGGIISWPDAGEHVHIQGQMIPFNANEREGGVPENIHARVDFSDVAVELPQEDDGEKWYKIPYRLSAYRHATPPSVVERHGVGVYEYNVFKIISVPESVVRQLDSTSVLADQDNIVAEYLNPAIIDAERKQISGAVEETLS